MARGGIRKVSAMPKAAAPWSRDVTESLGRVARMGFRILNLQLLRAHFSFIERHQMSNEFVHQGYAVSPNAREREPKLWHWTANIRHPSNTHSCSQLTEISDPSAFDTNDEAIAYAKKSAISYIDYLIELHR